MHSTLVFAAALAVVASLEAHAHDHGHAHGGGTKRHKNRHDHRRRLDHPRLDPDSDINAFLDEEHARGVLNPRFTLVGLRDEGGGDGANAAAFSFASATTYNAETTSTSSVYEIQVVEATPSVTSDTIITAADGTSATYTAAADTRLLVAADAALTGDFALLTVDSSTSVVDGVARRAGEGLVKVTSVPGGNTTVADPAVPFVTPEWSCGADSVANGSSGGGRRATEGERDLRGHHHDDHDHHHHDHDHEHDLDSGDFLDRLRSDLGQNAKANIVGGGGLRRRRLDRELWPTDSFPNRYTYQVDLYIEIDQALVNHNGGSTTDTTGAVAYINALVTATSAIYEEEVDTHLNVLTIVVSNLYDHLVYANGDRALTALQIMENQYGPSGTTDWHYTHTNGQVPDLHHALLGNNLLGGIANRLLLGGNEGWAVCSPYAGFGVSTGILGTINDLSLGVYWDILVFAHEIGHNFGAKHTHDTTRAATIDTCTTTCPTINPGEATLMSYCDKCDGGFSNVALTFGGSWNEGPRMDITSWQDTADLGSFNTNPKIVPYEMWLWISTRGTCVQPTFTVPTQTCSSNSDCNDGNSCTIDTCDTSGSSNQCVNALKSNCCGNRICEAGESSSCSNDCGPYILASPPSYSFAVLGGFMFDVEAVNGISITGLTVYTTAATSISVYTASGGFADKSSNQASWRKIFDGQSTTVGGFVALGFEQEEVVSAGSTQAFYVATSGLHLGVPEEVSSNPWASDTSAPWVSGTNVEVLSPGLGHGSTEFSPSAGSSYQWLGHLWYKLHENGSTSPTTSPTMNPTGAPLTPAPTSNPTSSPSTSPSTSPTADPTVAPTRPQPTGNPSSSPSTGPSTSPTADPTHAPTTADPTSAPTTADPTSAPTTSEPTKNPTSSPSMSPTTADPTSAPTTMSPTKNPTVSPSMSPTTAVPSTSPTTPVPSKSPTSPPSKSPSVTPTYAPTNPPSTPNPSMSPTTPSPTKLANVSSPGVVTVDLAIPSGTLTTTMTIPGTVSFENTDISNMNQQEKASFANELAQALSVGCPKNSIQSCTVRILSFNGQPINTRLRRLSRQLQSTLVADYKIILEAICSGSTSTSTDCDDGNVQAVANALYEQVTGDLKEAIKDGTLVTTLQTSSATTSTLLAQATATGDFSAALIPILAYLSNWFPDWVGRSGTCKNDGSYPRYMAIMGSYFENSLDSCCKKYYDWDYPKCAGNSGTLPNGYYPNWGKIEAKCLESSEEMPPYIRANSEQWVYNDIEACCKDHYSWAYNECIMGSGGTLPTSVSGQWYVDWKVYKCVKDCADSSDSLCGGHAKSWDETYGSASECCGRIGYVERSECTP